MQITDIRIRKINLDSKMKAVVSVTFDNALVIHDIKVIEGTDKLFIAMPSRKTPDGEFKDIAHPINMDMRDALEKNILQKYQSALIAEEEEETDTLKS
ncbi:MAG: septation regulator SpoVG [Clostridia bacterium]|nr:septation regulator SpoVG [Clostridia bacterium]